MSREQPAVKSYFFGKGYNDLLNVIIDAWAGNAQSVKDINAKIKFQFKKKSKILKWIRILFYLFEELSIYIFGTLLCLVLSSAHMLLLFSVMLIIYVMFSVVWTADKIYTVFHKIFGACPKCKEKYTLPVYICKCGVEHTRLVPGVYGIFKRRCLCGEKLPTSFLNGRKNLKSKCPVCGNITDTKEAAPVCVTVIGGPSVGKTCYITAVMRELVEDACPLTDMKTRFYDNRNWVEYKNMTSKYRLGELQTKTSDINPVAFNLFISKKGNGPERLMYIYDIAGEAFSTGEALSNQKQYQYSHGFIFIIDPLSIPDIRIKYEHDEGFGSFGAGVSDINDTFDTFMNNLKRMSGLSANKLANAPCAVVVNKADAFDLERFIGDGAAENAVAQGKFKSKGQAFDAIIRDFLLKNGMTNFVNNLDICFKKVRYFSCSALGHTPDGRGFRPIRTFAPFEWIVSKVDKGLARNFSKYSSGRISVKIPRKTACDRQGNKYAVLGCIKCARQRYYCLAKMDDSGGFADNSVMLACGNIKDFGSLTFYNRDNMDKNAYQALDILCAYNWKQKIKYIKEKQEANSTNKIGQ